MRFAKAVVIVASLCSGVACFTGVAFGAEISWSNASGGNWSVGSNWTGGSVPGTADTAIISMDGTYTVTLDGDTTVAALTLGGSTGTQTLSLSSKSLTVGGNFGINSNGVLSSSSSTIGGAGTIGNSGTINLTVTTINNDLDNAGLITIQGGCNLSGTITTQTSSTIRLTYISNYGSDLIVANGFTNNGLVELKNTYAQMSAIIRTTSGPLVNSATGTITANSTTGGQMILGELDNQGTIEIGRLLRLDLASANHTNSGTINATGGNLFINQTAIPGP
jgi:hypothetical protein